MYMSTTPVPAPVHYSTRIWKAFAKKIDHLQKVYIPTT